MTKNSRNPIVTLSLVVANVAVAYLVAFWPDAVIDFGFRADEPVWYTALTSLFLHQNLMHLLGNLVFLAAVGPAVELAAGRPRFLIVYIFGGLGGVLAHWIFMRHLVLGAPLIGASGCIAACIGYYSVRYIGLQVKLAPKLGVPVLAVVLLWVVLQVLGAVVTLGGAAPGYWAHLGGLLVGLLLSLFFKAPKQADLQLGHHVMDQMEARSAAAKLAATDLHLSEYPDDARALFKKIEAHAMMGDYEHEADALVMLLEKLPPEDHLPVVKRLLGIGQVNKMSSIQRLKLAEKNKSDSAFAKALLLSVVSDPKDSQRPDALLALVSTCDSEEAKIWAEELRETYPLHPATSLGVARGIM